MGKIFFHTLKTKPLFYIQLFKCKNKLIFLNISKHKNLSEKTKKLVEDIVKKIFPNSKTLFKKEKIFFTNEISQIKAYFNKKNTFFNLELFLSGTEFQKNIWSLIKKIPYGKTISYSEIATKIGIHNAARAVGNACGKNPLPIIIPCHRVVKKNKDPGGFNGSPEIKKYLLELEKNFI